MNKKQEDDQEQRTLVYKCPHCNAVQEVASSGVSRKIRCINCKTEFIASSQARLAPPTPYTQSEKRMGCLWIGIAIFVVMGLFPPDESGRYGVEYDFILNVSNIAFSRLFVQWVIVAVITGGLVYTFKDKKPEDEQNNK